MRAEKLSTLLTVSLAMAGACGLTLLTGCGMGAVNTTLAPQTVTTGISGKVHGGQNPIGGSLVQLWETSVTGYGGTTTQLVASTTSAAVSGAFSFPVSNVPSNCTTGPFAYITATGGDPTGATTNNTNTGINLAAMLGSCATTGASTTVIVNEVTTVAAAYALSGFAADTAGVISIGAPASNAQGLADAVANAGLLVNTTSGLANASTATLLLPSTTINSLANALAACVNTASTSTTLSANCSNLYAYTTPPGGTAPTDTFQAALNMAKYPGSNVAPILSLGSASAPFVPGLATTTVTTGSSTVAGTAPIDLTVGIGFLNASIAGAYESPTTLAIDKSDNVFVVGASGTASDTTHYAAGTTQWLGEISASSTGSSTPYTATSSTSIAGEPETALIDTNNNIWIGQNYAPSSTLASIIEIPGENMANARNLSVYDPSGASLDEAQNTWAIAIDGSSDVFTSTYRGAGSCATSVGTTANSICEYQELTPAQQSSSTPTFTDAFGSGATRELTNTTRGMFADANTSVTTYNGDIWATNYDSNVVELLAPGNGSTAAALTTYTAGTGSNTLFGIALDKSSNAWLTSYATAGLWEIPAGSAASTAATAANAASPASVQTAAQLPSSTATQGTVGGLYHPKYLAIDGAGNIFMANYGYNTVAEYSPSYNGNAGAYLSPYYGFSPSLTVPAGTLAVTAYSINSSNVVTVYAVNNLAVGQQVTLSGFPTSTFLNGVTLTVASDYGADFTASSSSFTHASVSKTTEAGTAATGASSQAVFTCTASATSTCSVSNPAFSFNDNVVVDKAGSVWSLSSNGTVVEMIGLAAPTDPVLPDGKYGVEP